MSYERFDKQVAVITGAAQGLGAAIARFLSERGAAVHLLDMNGAKLSETALKIGAGATSHVLDVTNEAELAKVRDKVLVGSGGKIDILINNAGIYPFENTQAITSESWDRVFNVNTKSTFLASRVFMEPMKTQNAGRIVFIASTDSYIPKPLYPHYAASKAAVRSLVKTFALELAPHNILVNGVSPGSIATDRAKEQGWLPRAIARIPLGRAATPEQIAEIVLFLASARNEFITGETIIASGGEIMD
jgi:3-oxoacyl-[acyl-carrier protein] reductase